MTKNLVIVGCGSMGSAILDGFLNKNKENFYYTIVSPNKQKAERFLSCANVSWIPSPDAIDYRVDIVIFCTKPMVLESILPNYKRLISKDTLVISVAAGKDTSFFKNILGVDIVRAMPNLPVSINQGVIGLYAPSPFRLKFGEAVTQLFSTIGLVTWIENEALMNAVTALSGSGPAYVYYMIECMTKAGEELGLDPRQSYDMALQTIIGAGLYAKESGEVAETLRKKVTSPNGTTQAALNILMEDKGFCSNIADAMRAARNRGVELSK